MTHRYFGPLSPPIHEQAAAMGCGHVLPVGMSAGALRALGFDVSADIPDAATYEVDPDSPTGHQWKSTDETDIAWWLKTPALPLELLEHVDGMAAHYRTQAGAVAIVKGAEDYAAFILGLPPAVRAFVYAAFNGDVAANAGDAGTLRRAILGGVMAAYETVANRLRFAVAT